MVGTSGSIDPDPLQRLLRLRLLYFFCTHLVYVYPNLLSMNNINAA